MSVAKWMEQRGKLGANRALRRGERDQVARFGFTLLADHV